MQIAKFAAVPPDDGFYLQLHLLHELFGHGWMTDDAQSVVFAKIKSVSDVCVASCRLKESAWLQLVMDLF